MTAKRKLAKQSQRGKRSVGREVSRLTAGVAGTALDLVVFVLAVAGGFFICGPRGKDLYPEKKIEASWDLANFLFEKYTDSRFRQALTRAASQDLVKHEGRGGWQLTEKGKKRLGELLPTYKQSAKWDGRLWLVIYDVPEVSRKNRNHLRKYLREIGCRPIQESVWLSVKDPRKWLVSVVNQLHLHGQVVVSCMGRDGSIGEEGIRPLVARVFNLNQLSHRYRDWHQKALRAPVNKMHLHAIEFLGIIHDDPMLPPALLPQPWDGKSAIEFFNLKILPKLDNSLLYSLLNSNSLVH